MPDVVIFTSNTDDREIRIEEDAFAKAITAIAPSARITLLDDAQPGDILLGRVPDRAIYLYEGIFPRALDLCVDYWNWPIFQTHAGRAVELCDYGTAKQLVEQHQSATGRAFVKSTQQKLFAQTLEHGTSLSEAVGDLGYTFADGGKCLVVQEWADIQYEYRLLVLDGEIITGAGAVPSMTPLENQARFDPKVARKFGDELVEDSPALVEMYLSFASEIVGNVPVKSFTLDLCLINGRPRIVEFNPLLPGRIGLYACDVGELARATMALIWKNETELIASYEAFHASLEEDDYVDFVG